jgi:outer membrane biosynthesis protein TonB
MKTIISIALVVLIGAMANPLFSQDTEPQPPQKEQVKQQPPEVPPAQPQPKPPEKEKEEVKQVAPNKPDQPTPRQQMRRDRGARPEIVRPGGRPTGAGRPQGARRPGRR